MTTSMETTRTGIPAIPSYPMPTGAELPPQVVPWQPDAGRAVLLVHDMQRYFLEPFPPDASPTVDLLTNVRALRDECHRLGIPVVYTAQPGGMSPQDRGLLLDFWGPGMAAVPEHRAIVDAVTPGPVDVVLTKWRYSAFHRTPLREVLHRHGRDQLVVCGVYAHMGCLMSAMDAFSHDVQPFLVADAVADLTPEYHRLALDLAARRCAATPTTAEVLADLRRAAHPGS
jgi:isochorismate hydrolase